MTIEFWPRRLLKPKPAWKPLPPRARRPKLPVRAGQAHQKLSQAIICGDHALASWLDLVVKQDLVIGPPEVVKELRERLDAVMEPLPAWNRCHCRTILVSVHLSSSRRKEPTMFHHDRTWCVTSVASAEELAQKLTSIVWTCCTAFELGGYLWLNDSTSPDGAAEFAVLKRLTPDGPMLQIESITFGWCDYDTSLAYIQQTLRGEFAGSKFAHEVQPRLQTPQEHGRCHHCA